MADCSVASHAVFRRITVVDETAEPPGNTQAVYVLHNAHLVEALISMEELL